MNNDGLSTSKRVLIGALGVVGLVLAVPGFFVAYILGTPGSVDGSRFLDGNPSCPVELGHIWAGVGGMGAVAMLAAASVVALAAAIGRSQRWLAWLRRALPVAGVYAVLLVPGVALVSDANC